MDFYRFDKKAGHSITKFESDFMMSRILQTENPLHIGAMHLEAGGKIGYHQAVVDQIMLIVSGEGEVCGTDKVFHHVKSGTAIFWEQDEWHETQSEHGLMAIVIEGEELNPSHMTLLKR
ncbi:cupin [Thalassobacillus devorans]|uniref:cupin n=1 Tax=Thalassobacillus devorans TaxID=279813 RepID=UPI00048E2B2C|nr:cupin [Thalassobacillus devorans]